MAGSNKPKATFANNSIHNSIDGLVGFHFNAVELYVAVLLAMAVLIVWSGIRTAEQVQQYHQDYKTLQDMKKQERLLQVEHQRLLIEQQTFSATPQIASRAVTELGMFSPTLDDKLIIQPAAPKLSQSGGAGQ